MKRKTASFTGMRPIFTGSPSIVQGGFNLDVENQHFAVGDTVPAGTLAIKDEVKRTVQVIKTAKWWKWMRKHQESKPVRG